MIKIHIPISLKHIIENTQRQLYINVNSMVDITPLEAFEIIENGLKKLNPYIMFLHQNYLKQCITFI